MIHRHFLADTETKKAYNGFQQFVPTYSLSMTEKSTELLTSMSNRMQVQGHSVSVSVNEPYY